MRRLFFLCTLALSAVAFTAGTASASPAATDISAEEQQFIYELNLARSDPAAYASANLTGSLQARVSLVAPRPPLAVNPQLSSSSRFHSTEMEAYGYFAHQSAVTGDWPNQVARDHGYPLVSWWPSDLNCIESISAGRPLDYAAALRLLISSDPHRSHLLGEEEFFSTHREVGVGWATGDLDYWSIHTGLDDGSDPFLTGVVYEDANGNGRMDLGEGMAGVEVGTEGDSTLTNAGGGWSLRVAGSASHVVTAEGGGFPGRAVRIVTVDSDNLLVDFVAGETMPTDADSPALFDPATGTWHVRHADGSESTFFFGDPGDTPLLGDWDCDGIDTPAMYRPSNGFIYLRNSNTSGWGEMEFYFGTPGDTPLAGDWDGDGCDTFAVYRNGTVLVKNSLGTGVAEHSFYFGDAGDRPYAGDFDADGIDTIGLYREGTGFVYFRNSLTSGPADFDFFYGAPSDRMVAGDWDGDGFDTIGVFRPADGCFYLSNANRQGFADITLAFGSGDWLPAGGGG